MNAPHELWFFALAIRITVCDLGGMDKPSPKAIVEATGISQPYASMILAEDETKRRTPPRPLAIAIFRKLGWRHETIADLTEQQMAVLEEIEPWQAPQERAA